MRQCRLTRRPSYSHSHKNPAFSGRQKGDVRMLIHYIAHALHVFGEIQALKILLGTAKYHRPDADGCPIAQERAQQA